MSFPEEGPDIGCGPLRCLHGPPDGACNPWFTPEALEFTQDGACPDHGDEKTFLSALREMTIAEVQGNVLILSDETGREMVFRAGAGG